MKSSDQSLGVEGSIAKPVDSTKTEQFRWVGQSWVVCPIGLAGLHDSRLGTQSSFTLPARLSLIAILAVTMMTHTFAAHLTSSWVHRISFAKLIRVGPVRVRGQNSPNLSIAFAAVTWYAQFVETWTKRHQVVLLDSRCYNMYGARDGDGRRCVLWRARSCFFVAFFFTFLIIYCGDSHICVQTQQIQGFTKFSKPFSVLIFSKSLSTNFTW